MSDFVSHKRVSVAVSVISSLLASIFLIGAILGLYWVTNPNAKLGMLSGLTVAFAGSLALFTNARRQDVFAATAAYAAVLVVFISGNLGSDSSATVSSSMSVAQTLTSTLFQTFIIYSTFSTSEIFTASTTVQTTLLATASSETPTSPTSSSQASTQIPSSGLSNSAKIGLGVGLGIGVPAIAISIYACVLYRIVKKRVRAK